MTTEKHLTYRGDIQAAVGVGDTLAFVTLHHEGQPTALYRLNVDKLTLAADVLPAGGVALVADGETLWVGGSDGHVYQCSVQGSAPKPRGPKLPAPPTRLALLADGRLAVLAAQDITILARKDGKVLQTLTLPEAGTALASDPTGHWLIAGTAKGTVAVFDSEDKDEFLLGESDKLHEGAVTALLFEPDELRFLSAGADQKLLSTHARGKLEPEDKGRGNSHTDVVTALLWGPGDRFFSGSRDKTVKNWPRVGNIKPMTEKDNVIAVIDLTLVSIANRSYLAVACEGLRLFLFPLDAAGKLGDCSHKIHGAYVWAREESGQDDPRRREAALQALADYNDAEAIEILSQRIERDGDHGLRLLAAQLLSAATHPRAAKLLEQWLGHTDEAVRRSALTGLRNHLGEHDLRPLDLALKTDKADVGTEAVQALESLAKKDDQALARLTEALDAKTPAVRQAALASLEKVHDPQSPEASLIALRSQHGDLRRLALVRLFQRQLLPDARVQATLRRRSEDADADVRKTAFFLSLYTRARLVPVLRGRDPDLHRQLVELEIAGQEPAPEAKKGKSAKAKPAEPVVGAIAGPVETLAASKAQATRPSLTEADYEPLLQAAASRALDTCVRGASGLAVLGDARAFGLLLQLSREEDVPARVGVCRALAVLDDPRSVERLRSLLYDADATVRDAAFTALTHIHTNDPLLGAESGLNASFEDVRRRGLQVLISLLRKTPPKKADEPGWLLLVRALNDSFESVRGEAFKAALNLKIGGGGVQTLRFVLQSVHAEIRREVLTEAMAQVRETWAWNLLLEFYNDADPTLREEAFDFAVKKTKELAPLEAGLLSQYADVRKRAVAALVKKHTKAAQALLARAVNDTEKEIRALALQSLADEDARPALLEALKSPHADVRVQAASALAAHGHPAALAPLLALATTELPAQKERRKEWAALVKDALTGLADQGDSAALPHIIAHLKTKSRSVRKMAIYALVWSAIPNHLEALRQALQHADPEVKYRAAVGLAFAGDPLAAALVFSEEGVKVLSAVSRVVGAFCLQTAGEDQLVAFLDNDDDTVRRHALVLLLMRELKSHEGMPRRCLACLSSRMPRVRLLAARALECFADPTAFRDLVTQVINDRDDEQPWKVSAETVDTLAELLCHGTTYLRAHMASFLQHLAEKEQTLFNQTWSILQARYAAEITTIREQVKERPPVPLRYDAAQLRELAFGAYVGLVREQGSAHERQQRASLGAQVIHVRQTALARVLALAQAERHFADAARPVFVQALGDPNEAVRVQAFEHLQTLGVDRAMLGAEALETGHSDLGVAGLKLLAESAAAGKGQAILEQVMMTRTDHGLAQSAAKLLMAQRGAVPVAVQALNAADEDLRQQAIGWLAGAYEENKDAPKQLRQALQSRYQKVREAAALALATKKDASAFDALVQLLATQEASRQRQVIAALVQLGDPRASDALLDRLTNDPTGTALADEVFAAVGGFRRPASVDRLLAMMDKDPKWRSVAFGAASRVAGFDQPIDDPDDERPDHSWEEKQFPRHAAVAARLLERCLSLGETALLKTLVVSIPWARGPEVDPPLALLVHHSDDELRRQAIAKLGWRLRKRNGPAEPLLKALAHKDPVSQFLAAEGLAKAGRAEGLSVLLSAVEFMTDLDVRQRAVRALGELADSRALDILLRLAGEDGHALQEEAAEAIGHLGKSAKAETIFQLLERFARGAGSVAGNAIRGLRWFNTVAGWQLVRKRATDPAFPFRETAVEVLGHNDDPATRDLLLRLVAEEDDWSVFNAATTSAVRLLGAGSLEVDYAWLQNDLAEDNNPGEALQRVGERGDPRRIVAILSKCAASIQEALEVGLLNRSVLPITEAQEAIGGSDAQTVQLAAQIIGRAGPQVSKSAGAAVQTALQKWQTEWERCRKAAQANDDDGHLGHNVTPCLEGVIWAAGRLGVAPEALLSTATAWADDAHYRPVRRAALAALAGGKITEPVLQVFETAALGNDPELRTLAVEAIARQSAARAVQLAEKMLSDRVSFNRLTRREGVQLEAVLRAAAAQVHYQAVALPHLIAQADVDGLAGVLDNAKLPEATRLGAIEGLGRLATEPAEARLLRFAQVQKEDEDLRKAAWRALRRSKRARKRKPQVASGGALAP